MKKKRIKNIVHSDKDCNLDEINLGVQNLKILH
jgi:hypothetical protein